MDEFSIGDLVAELVRRGTTLAEIESLACQAALRSEGAVNTAAEKLGTNRHALSRRIIKYGISYRKVWS